MSETPPVPNSISPQPPAAAGGSGSLRVVAILVMIGSILGLLGGGFCVLSVATDGYFDLSILLLIAPSLLFFAGSIWVCKALLDRLKK